MNRPQNIAFELPDDLVIGAADDDDNERQGAGSTLPQDLFPLGVLGEGAGRLNARNAAQPMPDMAGDTLPPDLAPDTPAVSAQQAESRAIIAPIHPRGRSAQDGPLPKRVLVVDDDLAARHYMRARMMLRGHLLLHETTSGEEAMRIFHAHSFDAVFLDMDIGQQIGLQTCRAMRSFVRRENGKQPRIYIISSGTSLLDKIRARMAGADAFLSKPLFPAELASMLDQL